ncbi:prepilin-type N-terminal cleavage/methylation domain-containing protein [Rhodoblastus acidophilus]|uniref:Prepilin-type N-terminal cleavage/methylation domain-containing protein n=1 Tax=Candidatus Rhodoblastus alkanivorans TaxID=2954117 RepID=A0ABS9ZDK2_9HYPH|nr:prepilin-type N-terminal cleavage/methylation domain-containing protein [Candidatus Rhodoblastus alkanivorans]MCI4677164.1 prepilin-type N-terminal cleavage/methylation domain-containing protein [Candidatus Rhodoblastus alkanivorans]MCI4684517.1 prepilin-type N-terminal cleavage/methylation domain-containing protein [Candidatus Rhodoblastus alkanivorans]MDI4641838.1 prepilin-type N-terminal cleavage/methylation domain-containing protein [Rhodoblastus acidophilus]
MKRRPPDGFTLLELLVALSLVSLMIVALAGGLRIGTRAWQSGRAGVSIDEAELAARAIAGQLERAFPATLRRANGPPVVAFDGGPDNCRFVALSEGDAQWGGLIATEIGIDGAGPGRSLDAWTQVFREDDFANGRDAMRETRLIDRLAFLRFSYYGAADSSQKPRWRDDWRRAALPPLLVRARIGLNGPNGVIETSAIVDLRQR